MPSSLQMLVNQTDRQTNTGRRSHVNGNVFSGEGLDALAKNDFGTLETGMDVALHCPEAQARGKRYKPAACVGAKAKVPDRCTGYE